MVVFVMIDGLRPDAISGANCTTIQSLISKGASTMTAQSVMPSVTLPCHTSIFHSVPPSRHGITTNYFVPMARPLPGLVEVARGAGKKSAFVHNWEPLRDLARPEHIVYSWYHEPPLAPDYDDEMHAEALRVLKSNRYDFVFVYYGSVDTAGHAYGWMEPGYLQQCKHVDTLLSELVAAMPADTHMIVQADHGGHDRNHGTDCAEDMTIPWIAVGPRIKPNHTISYPVSLMDTAPNLAHMLGVKPHEEWEGYVIDEMFIDA
ncbi:MAG: alkaline phosphatase family protein [Roseiflexaceae bacterium]